MPRINYGEEESFYGRMFSKDEIFYWDLICAEWSWWDYYIRRIVVMIFCVPVFSIFNWIILYLLFGNRPRKRRFLVAEDFVVWRSAWPALFCSYSSWGRAQKKDIIGIEIFKVDGEVCVYKKGMFWGRKKVANVRDIGRIELLIDVLSSRGYPVTVFNW